MLNLKDYLWHVYEISTNNPNARDQGVAYDMLRNNIKHGREVDPGTNLDWAALKVQWDAMTPDEQSRSREEYQLCDNAPGLWDAFEAGNRSEFDRLKEAAFAEAKAKSAQ